MTLAGWERLDVKMHACTLGGLAVKILTRMCTSLDGRVTTEDGLPVQLAFPGWNAGALGFYQVQGRCDAVLMGRATFEPALSAPYWPWGELAVYVLGSHLPAGAPDRVVIDDDPARLLERLRGENKGGGVHLVGGPKTIETYRALGALDEFRLMVLPIFVGKGRPFTSELSTDIALTLTETRAWPDSVVEVVYKLTRGDSSEKTESA